MDASLDTTHHNQHHRVQVSEEDYIDTDLSCAANLLSSPLHSIDFEFKMTANSADMQPFTSPADELFYNGKLLPLHQSPCMQMADKQLQSPSTISHEQFDITRVITSAQALESFNYSTPATPCYDSYDLNPADSYYVQDCSQARKHSSWSKRLKFIRQSNIGSRLKASKAYLKSIFRKNSNSSDKVLVECSNSINREPESKARDVVDMKNVVGVCEEKLVGVSVHRRSFSGAIKCQLYSAKSSSFSLSSSTSCSSSFSSVRSDDLYGQPMLKRSSSVNSDIENSIQGAIAYCKKSQLERV